MPLETTTAPASLRVPLRVRNNEPNKTVFTKQVNGDPLKIIFGANGQADDTQRVPLALAEDIDFLNSLEQGCLTVVGGPPDVVEYLQQERSQIRSERQAAEKRRIESSMDRHQEKDMIGTACVGPAPVGRKGTCDRPVIQSATQAGQAPPLCPQHEPMSTQFHLVEVGSKGEAESGASETSAGVVRREWKQAVITDRQRGE